MDANVVEYPCDKTPAGVAVRVEDRHRGPLGYWHALLDDGGIGDCEGKPELGREIAGHACDR